MFLKGWHATNATFDNSHAIVITSSLERQSMSNHPFDFSHLSPAERILLAEDLWDSVTAKADAPPLSQAQEEELRHRLAAADRGETSYSSWLDIKRRLIQPK